MSRVTNLSEGFQNCARRELDRLLEELQALDSQLSDLNAQRNQLAPQIECLRALLGEVPLQPLQNRPGIKTTRPRKPRRANGASDADRVVALLRESGQPIHYRDIYQRLVNDGVQVGGKDPAGTLLARYFDDPRLYRPTRGTYGLVEWRDRAS